MELNVNGKPVEIGAAESVSELLAQMGLTGKRVAVEVNGEIVPKSAHATTTIAPTDKLEIVVAVGGG